MKNRFLNDFNIKLHSRAGETISETLVSLLIASLALVVLAGSIAAASGIIQRSRTKLDKYYNNAEDMVNMPDTVPSIASDDPTITKGEATVTISEAGPRQVLSATVDYYDNFEFGRTHVISYREKGH